MKRNAKIIQISGLRGILTAIFIVTCLAAGFVVFPGFVAMNIWNHFSGNYVLNIYQGILLWAIIALICFIANKQRFSVSIETPKELSEEEMNLGNHAFTRAKGILNRNEITCGDMFLL